MTQWIQSRSVGQMLSYLSLVVIVALAAGFFFLLPSPPRNKTHASGTPPVIDAVGNVSLSAPSSGDANMVVPITVVAVASDVVTIYAINHTLGETTTGTWNTTTGADIDFPASAGDLVSIKVGDGGTPEITDTAAVGYVPSPSDATKPYFDVSKISTTFVANKFEVTVSPGGFQDSSWPGHLQLIVDGTVVDTDANVPNNSSQNTNSQLLDTSIVTTGDRVVLRATDDYGNRTDLHFVVSGSTTAADSSHFPSVPTYKPTGSTSVAERTGNQPVAGTGVHLFDRNFVTSQTVYSLGGAGLNFDVTLLYRSTMGYNGTVGRSWDWNLDSRLDKPGTYYRWWPGTGQVIPGFATGGRATAGIFWDFDIVSGDWTLTNAEGYRYTFDATTGLLKQIQDGYYDGTNGHAITITRNTDDQVVLVEGPQGRKVHFSYFDHGRLASIDDFGGRRVLFEYDDDGCLTKVVRPDESFWSWDYTKQNSKYLLSHVYQATEDGETAVAAVKTTYDGTDNRVTEQRTVFNMKFGDPTKFTDNPTAGPTPPSKTDMDVVRVEDPSGNYTDYGFADSHGDLLVVRRHHDIDLRDTTPWTTGTNPDPDWIDAWQEFDTNKLLNARYFQYEGQATSTDHLEREEWIYETPDAPTGSDPSLRARVATHTMKGDPGTTSDDIDQDWTFGTSGDDAWPSQHVDFNGVTTDYTYDSHGAMTSRKIEDVTQVVTASIYDIETSWSYNLDGRLEKVTNPNRNDDPSTHPSIKYSYHTSGHQQGYLKKEEHLNSGGATLLWTSHEYDSYGNVTRTEDQASIVTQYEYDPLNRRTKKIWVDDFNHPGATNTSQTQVQTNVFEGDELVEVKQTNFDELGVGGSHLTMQKYEFQETTASTNAVRVSEQRYGLSTGTATFTKSETEYDSRGLPIKVREYYGTGTSDHTERESSYDGIGQLYKTSLDPSVASNDEMEEWHAYDYRGRQVEFWKTNWDQPRRSYYDDYGRMAKEISTRVVLGRTFNEVLQTYGSAQYGYFSTIHNYATTSKPLLESSTESRAYVESAPLAPTDASFDSQTHTLTKETKYSYDEAGRRTKTEEKIDSTDYAVTQYQLLPGGQTSRMHLPHKGSVADYTETKYDSLDRVTEEIDATGNNKVCTDYDSSTQLVSKTDRKVWDEVDTATRTYRTQYYYDSRGRVKEARRMPDGTGNSINSFTAYDGLGNVARTWTKQDGSDNGLIVERIYDLAGRQLEEKRGLDDNDDDVVDAGYARKRYTYDRSGRRTKEEVLLEEGTPDTWLVTETEYDDANRVTKVTHPPYAAPAAARETIYTYAYASHASSISLPSVQERQPTAATGKTIRNQLGHILETSISSFGDTGTTVTGPKLVEFAYSDPASCGCARSGSPVEARVFHDATPTSTLSQGDSIVTRSYGFGGVTDEETVSVYDGSDWHNETLEFEHDEQRRLDKITFPDNVELTYSYREDGVIDAMSRNDGTTRDIAVYKYAGQSQRDRLSYDGQGTATVNEVADGGPEYDAFGRLELVSWNTRNGSDYDEEITERTADGLPVARTRATSANDQFTYVGDNWLASEVLSLTVQTTRTYNRNNAGILTSFEVDDGTSTTWTYHFGSDEGEAGLPTSLTGDHVASAPNARVAFNPQDAENEYVSRTETVSERTWDYDDSGRVATYSYELDVDLHCVDIPASSDTWHEYQDLVIDETTKYDFWGRRVEWHRTGDGDRRTFECNTSAIVSDWISYTLPALDRYYYLDAYGRLIYETVDGDYFAHLDDELEDDLQAGLLDPGDIAIAVSVEEHHPEEVFYAYDTQRVALAAEFHGTSQTAGTRTQYYTNPTTGRPDKGHQDPDPSSGSDDALFTLLGNSDGDVVLGNSRSRLSAAPAEGAMTVLYYGAANVVQYLNWAILQDGADPEATEDDILVLPTSTPSCHDWSPTKEVTRYANIEHTGLAKWRSRVQYKVKYWSCELSDGIVDAYTEKFVSTPDEHSIDGTDILEEAGLGLGPVHGLGKLVGLGGLSKGLKDVDLIGALDVRWTHQATPEDRKKVETGCAPGCKNHTLKARIKVTGTAQWLPNIVWNPGFLTETVDGGSVLIDVSGYCCAQD